MDTAVKEKLLTNLPDALCIICKGEGAIEVPVDPDLDSITEEAECRNCEGSGIEPGYEDDVIKELYGKRHADEFQGFLNDLQK